MRKKVGRSQAPLTMGQLVLGAWLAEGLTQSSACKKPGFTYVHVPMCEYTQNDGEFSKVDVLGQENKRAKSANVHFIVSLHMCDPQALEQGRNH